jgi:hypothetical protein
MTDTNNKSRPTASVRANRLAVSIPAAGAFELTTLIHESLALIAHPSRLARVWSW